jgi:hypothetical protein
LTDLTYARKDAESMAAYLRSEGFEVTSLFDAQATKTTIISKMLNLARLVKKEDRIMIFFSGHGYTERLGGKDYGYIIPYDGYDSATYLSMEELRAQSEKMGAAKHQLFIMDCCYGGLLGMRNVRVESNIPNYLEDVTGRVARQILTAGGKDQEVLDSGPDGHSVFTAQLLKALQNGMADLNKDNYITFNELCSFIVPSASNAYQTPATGTLPGHELGEFVFRAPKRTTPPVVPPAEPANVTRRDKENIGADPNRAANPTTSAPRRGPTVSLRSTADDDLFETTVSDMLAKRNFFDFKNNKNAPGFDNDYEPQSFGGDKVVVDHATGLMWQKSGSRYLMTYAEAIKWVENLKAKGFAGFHDWRLPTLEEAMSLMEPQTNESNLYIDSRFDPTQAWIWTIDKYASSLEWVVYFGNGYCGLPRFDGNGCVRAVR